MAQKTTRITTPTATKTISFENLRIRRQQQASKMYKQPLPFSVCDNTESSAIGLLLWALGKVLFSEAISLTIYALYRI